MSDDVVVEPVADAPPVAPPVVEPPAAPPVAPAVVEPAWRDDWRQKLAGEDKADLKTLERIASVEDIWKQNKLLRQKMSSGELKKDLPANATPEQVAEWRKEAGFPETPADYKLDLQGYLPAAPDAPMLEKFKAFAHSKNVSPDLASAMARWVFEESAQAVIHNQQIKEEADAQQKFNGEAELKAEWGKEFTSHKNTTGMHLDTAYGAEFRDYMMKSRGPDGKLYADNPYAMRILAREAVRVMPFESRFSSPGHDGRGGDDRIAEIEKFMRTNRAEYFKDKNMDAEYKALIDARDRAKARAA